MLKPFVVATALVILGIPAVSAAPGARESSVQRGETDAAKQCKAERQRSGVQAFANAHGTNTNKRNAFGKCVSATSKDKHGVEADAENDDDPATKGCRSERASMPAEAFAEKYGTNHNSRNAFGKCVSGKG